MSLTRTTPAAIAFKPDDSPPNHVPDLRGFDGETAPCKRCHQPVTPTAWAKETCPGVPTSPSAPSPSEPSRATDLPQGRAGRVGSSHPYEAAP